MHVMHYDLSYLSNLVTLCELETYDHIKCVMFHFLKREFRMRKDCAGVLFLFSF